MSKKELQNCLDISGKSSTFVKMFSIIEHIEYLISDHDCVIVPGLGAFIAQYIHAEIDLERGVILPPRRVLSFNAAVCHNDGVLANSVMRREGLTYEAAIKVIEAEVSSIKSDLKNGGEVAIGRMGCLMQNSDNTSILFVPCNQANLRCDYFALDSVALPSIEDCEQEEEKESWLIRYPFLRAAASVIVLLVLTIFLSTPITIEKGMTPEMASMSLLNDNEPSIPLPETGQLSIAIPAEDEGMAVVDTTAHHFQPVNEGVIFGEKNDSAKYYLIVSSHSNRKEAERYVAASDNTEHLNIMEKGSKFRVYIAAGDDFEEINNLRKKMSADNPDIWICVK